MAAAANIIGFVVDIGINVAVLIEAFAPKDNGPVVMIGAGSQALGQVDSAPNNEGPGGTLPFMSLYDTHAKNFAVDTAHGGELVSGDNQKVHFQKGVDNDNLNSDPQYMRLQANPFINDDNFLGNRADPVCVSYVTVTGANGAHTSWHAGYAKQCGAPWYPSPELFPTTSFVPGCVWLTDDTNFPGLQGITFKLTDLSFQSTAESGAAQKQFTDHPETLCNAPGRMAFWKTSFHNDCIPFYDFLEEKDPTTGVDADMQKIQTGHTMRCTPKGEMFVQPTGTPGAGAFGGVAGSVPIGSFGGVSSSIPDSQIGQPPPGSPGAGSFGGVEGSIPLSQVGEAPPDPSPSPTATPGAGSFGGVEGSIPNSEAAANQPAPTTTATTRTTTLPAKASPTIANAGSQGAVIVGFNPGGPSETTQKIGSKTRRSRRDLSSSSIVRKRAELESKGDHCVDRLTISHLPGHTASEVCNSKTSWGPDFVSVDEGLYCDMCERMLWSLCTGDGQSYCFDLEKRELRLPSLGEEEEEEESGDGVQQRGHAARDVAGAAELSGLRKRYRKVNEWSEWK